MDRFAFIIFLLAGNQSAKMLRVNVVETMPFTRAIRKIAASFAHEMALPSCLLTD